MSVNHRFRLEINNTINNEAFSLDTEEDQKKFIEQEVISDPFRVNPTTCHIQMHKKSNGKVGGILSMQKTRQIVHSTKNKLIFPRVSIENIRYAKTNRGTPFCQKVVFRGDSTFVFLFSQEQLKLLIEEKPKQFFVDGFHKTPKDFSQMVSMFAYVDTKRGSFCIFHCLMNSKAENNYQIMLEEFKVLLKPYNNENLLPEVITTDFDKALLNYFPDVQQSGVFSTGLNGRFGH